MTEQTEAAAVEAVARAIYKAGGGIHWEGEESWQERCKDQARAVLGMRLFAAREAAAEARGAERALRPVRRLVSSWEHGNDTFGATDRDRNRIAVLREIVGDEAQAAARGAEGGAGA